ncbi:MAG: hypothetical protein ACOZAR_00455 [Patescibacteria group bacterium]
MGNNQDLENLKIDKSAEIKKNDSDVATDDLFKNYDSGREGMGKIEGNVVALDEGEKEKLTEEQMEKLITKDQRLKLEELAETGSIEEMLLGLDQIFSSKMGVDTMDLVDANGVLTEKGKTICQYCRDFKKERDNFKPKEWLALVFADMRYAESMVKKPGDLKNMMDENSGEKYWEVYDKKNFDGLKNEAINIFDGKYKSEMRDLLKEEKALILFLPSLNGMQENQWELLDDYVHTLRRFKYKSVPEGIDRDEMEEQIREHIDSIGRIKGEENLWEKWEKYDEMEGEEKF